ncbi:hypothetical protein DFR86_09605 [Acidianus sulfidivorans JP7]|uniref:DNA repair protein n=1 Tax=Acidianus sulfidivorans JP7 TaxID=619593 RepID=A0A2U9IP62_9CREN|nr:Nre family DNA repair protein [Acidianus sulfidivorans]AWR97777.1 hypothetical protein DFR86_09605 [Acidianus sulfidivorans JP7]
MRKIPAELCVKCKGNKHLCGLSSCPILERFRSTIDVVNKIYNKDLIQGSTPPSAVISEKNYPNVKLLFNIPPEVTGDEAKKYEDPKGWWGKASIYEIINYRSALISNILDVKISDPWKLYEKEISLSSVSEKPVSSESKITSSIQPKLKFDGYLAPRGPTANSEQIKITENPKIAEVLDKLIFDDVKAEKGIIKLYESGYDLYKIINATSLGLLGIKKNRKLVPTRWAITAVDSTIGKNLLDKITNYKEINEVLVFYQKYLGNYFHIILYPSKYNVIWIEIWHPLTLWTNELVVSELKENFWGEYTFMDGGYMAARLSVLEYLEKIRRQSGIIIVREITNEYFAPLGNWHIRETVKNAMENKIAKFDNLKEALSFINTRLQSKIDLTELKSIKSILSQKNIEDFFLNNQR